MTDKKFTYAVRLIDKTGSVRIPTTVRNILGLEVGMSVTVSTEGNKLVIEGCKELDERCPNCGR